jgi:hypothetical protein
VFPIKGNHVRIGCLKIQNLDMVLVVTLNLMNFEWILEIVEVLDNQKCQVTEDLATKKWF